MEFLRNFPLFTIIITFIGVVLCSLLNRKGARITAIVCEVLAICFGVGVIVLTSINGPYNYQMGHFPAPFNNEIRFGVLEGLLATIFPLIILLSLLGGIKRIEEDISEKKEKFFYVLANLVLVALVALIYTNDIFTGYVFLEISTLSSIGLVMIKEKGSSAIAATRYMIFNLIGSGLFLIGCIMLYGLTGYLSMEYIKDYLNTTIDQVKYMPSITCTFALLAIGLGIKSGLFPFYFWMPDTYGNSTPASSSIVSGLISKGYIILIIKFIYRTFGVSLIAKTGILDLLFVLGAAGMILGSISAIAQKRVNKMIAFSSAAQIGYIYLAIGLGEAGMKAAFFQIICHAITKPLLFIATSGLVDTANGKEQFKYLKGAGRKNVLAGIGFFVGAMSMIGFPVTGGFVVKYLFVSSALAPAITPLKLYVTIAALVISTLLNTAYFIRTVITIYSPLSNEEIDSFKKEDHVPNRFSFMFSVIFFTALNIFIGTCPVIIDLIIKGLGMF